MIDRAALKAISPVYKLYQVYNYLLFQPKLGVAMLRDWIDRHDPACERVPPARLRYRVHGSLEKGSFLRLGQTITRNMKDLLTTIDRDLDSFGRVLEFGCGCGRVLRYLRESSPSCEFHGTDIDPELVAWCERNIPGVGWSTNGYSPPLSFSDGAFDLVYAISVFTHLDEDFQQAWLRELQRVAKPGAILILTVHGESLCHSLSPSEQDAIRARGFLYLTGATGRLKLDGLPDFYQTSFHSRDYINREWSKFFEVVNYFERAIDGYQDAVLLRKR